MHSRLQVDDAMILGLIVFFLKLLNSNLEGIFWSTQLSLEHCQKLSLSEFHPLDGSRVLLRTCS